MSPELYLLDVNNETVPLRALHRDQPLLIVLLRHFGCMFCRQQAARVLHQRGRFEALGVNVICVGSGSPRGARGFIRQHGAGLDVYVDPSLNIYAHFNLHRSWRRLVDPSMLSRGAAAYIEGHRQGETDGDIAQLGGTVLLSSAGEVLWLHRDERAGDHADLEEALDAARALQATAPAQESVAVVARS